MQEKHPIVGDVRGVGLIQGIEFVKHRTTKEHFDKSLGVNARLNERLADRGVWIRVPAFILPIAPPLTITADEMDQLADAVDGAIGDVEKELGLT